MNSEKNNVRIAGILYIAGTVTGILSVVVTGPLHKTEHLLAAVTAGEKTIVGGSLLILAMGFSLALMPVLLYPVLKKVNRTFAAGYTVFRGALETFTYMATAVCWMLLVPLGRACRSDAGISVHGNALGKILFEAPQLSSLAVIVFIIGALMFYGTLFQGRLVPRWISLWGIIAATPYLTCGLLGMYGVLDTSAGSGSPVSTLLFMPLAIQEMVLAVWMVVKGFHTG